MRTSSVLTGLVAGLLSMALVLGPVPVHAAPPGETVDELFPYGQEKFDNEEYGEAGDAWGKAVGLLAENKQNSATRQTLMDLALDAYLRAYRADGDRKWIDSAKALLVGYEKALKEATGSVSLTGEIFDRKEKVEEALAKIAAEDKDPETDPETDPEDKDPETDPGDPVTDPEDTDPATGGKPGTGLVIGGAVMIGLGVGGIGLLAAGAVGASAAQKDYDAAPDGSSEQAAAEKKGGTMNALTITGAVLAPILIGAGVALLIIGIKKNKKAAGNAMLVPTFGPSYAGVGLTGRF